MKYLFCVLLKLLICSNILGQYDTVIKSLIDIPSNSPERLNGFFKKSKETQSGAKVEFYKFSKFKIDFCYYPKQANISCGYFKLFGQVVIVSDKLDNNLNCDLDYGSFELYSYTLNKKKYLILNAIRYGSGTTTRFIYCNLFDITDKGSIIYYSLSSIYGSRLSFGDYNNDNKIDFLQIEYQKNSNSTDKFTLAMKTYNEDKQMFYLVEGKYINFVRRYKIDNSFEILKSDSNW